MAPFILTVAELDVIKVFFVILILVLIVSSALVVPHVAPGIFLDRFNGPLVSIFLNRRRDGLPLDRLLFDLLPVFVVSPL